MIKKILAYLNVSNIDNIECDSGYIFNYTLSKAFEDMGINFSIILPKELEEKNHRFSPCQCYYVDMGSTKYEARYHFDWDGVLKVVKDYEPDMMLLNQCELATSVRSLLVTNRLSFVKLTTYCHYPALHIADFDKICIDYTLNDSSLGQGIVFSILSAVNVSDSFVIQSHFARNLLLQFASYHNVELNKSIEVIPPPYDPNIIVFPKSSEAGDSILYNHRLYDSYGTQEFIRFVKQNRDLHFVVANPMTNRRKSRSQYNSSPESNSMLLGQEINVKIVDGGNRDKYIKTIDSCRFGIAPYRKACVWSMSIIDCFCRGIPVIGPDIAAFREIIPFELLYSTESEQKDLAHKLLSDNAFWNSCVVKCSNTLPSLAPKAIAEKFISSWN